MPGASHWAVSARLIERSADLSPSQNRHTMLPTSAPVLPAAAGGLGLWLLAALVPVLAGLWWYQTRRAARLQRALKASLEANSTLRHEDDDPNVPGLLSRTRVVLGFRAALTAPVQHSPSDLEPLNKQKHMCKLAVSCMYVPLCPRLTAQW